MTRLSGPLGLEDDFNEVVELTVTAEVGGETIICSTHCLAGVYRDQEARKVIEQQLRSILMHKILEKWTPVIKVRR